MNYTIANGELSVTVSTHGGELQSILDRDGREWLWQADPVFWDEKAPNLFPYIGRCTDDTYTFEGKPYRMCLHGFLHYSALELMVATENMLSFEYSACPESRAVYPFEFTYRIQYRLTGRKIAVKYTVLNNGSKAMYFGIGGHPGFRMPLDEGLDFTDYHLTFNNTEEPRRVILSPDSKVTAERAPYPLANGHDLPLRHDLFDNDAVILRGSGDKVVLHSDKGKHSVTVRYPQMPYIGIWHTKQAVAPFLCLEPWTALPSRSGVVEALETHPDLIRLGAHETYDNEWSIELH